MIVAPQGRSCWAMVLAHHDLNTGLVRIENTSAGSGPGDDLTTDYRASGLVHRFGLTVANVRSEVK